MPRKKSGCPYQGTQLELFDLLGCNALDANDELHPNNVKPGNLVDAHHWIEEKYIQRSGKWYGPYLYLRWREGKRHRSKYLGKSLVALRPPPN